MKKKKKNNIKRNVFMKNIFTLLLLAFAFTSTAQESQITGIQENDISIIEEYKKDTLSSDYAITFATSEDLTNFAKLRKYWQNKLSSINAIQNALPYYADSKRNMEIISSKAPELDRAIAEAQKNNPKEAIIDIYVPSCNINVYGSTPTSLEQLKALKTQITNCLNVELERQKEQSLLKRNLSILKKDYDLCENQINSSLTPEYKDQEFRKTISIGFACLLGGLLLVFVVVVFRSQKNVAEYFFSDTGLQFITIFVLIISIILFGILKILEGRELAAILAGISGYILGKSRPTTPKSEKTESFEIGNTKVEKTETNV